MELILAGGLAVFSVALRVAITLLNLIGMYRIFQKMGMPGWKGLVPIYNNFNLYGLLWESKFFWLQLIASFCVSIPTNEESPLFLSLVVIVMSVVNLVLTMKLYIRLAHAFGKGTGFGVLTYFFAPICLAVLGFGSAEYEGQRPSL